MFLAASILSRHGANDGRPHDVLNIGLGREMPAKCVALLFIHAVLKQRTEDRRIDLRPVFGGGTVLATQKQKLRSPQFNWFNGAEQAAIEISDAFETSTYAQEQDCSFGERGRRRDRKSFACVRGNQQPMHLDRSRGKQIDVLGNH